MLILIKQQSISDFLIIVKIQFIYIRKKLTLGMLGLSL